MSFKKSDAVVTITDQGINEAIKQFLRWRNPSLFPYKYYYRFDKLDPLVAPIDMKLEIPLPSIHFDGSKGKNGIQAVVKAIGYLDNETLAFTIGVIFDYIISDEEIGLRFRDITLSIDVNDENTTDVSLAESLQGHLETLRYALQDAPIFGDYLNFIPLFSTATVGLGAKPSIAVNINEFVLLQDSEGLFMGSNEIQVKGKIELFSPGKTEKDEIGTFGIPYTDNVEEGDTKPINQRIVFERPEVGTELLITCSMMEIDTFTPDQFKSIQSRYKVEADEVNGIRFRRLGNIMDYLPSAPYDTVPNTNTRPGVIDYNRPVWIFPDLNEEDLLEYKISISFENIAGRIGHFVLPSDSNIESNQIIIQGAIKEVGTLSFGFTLWNTVELEYQWSHVWVDPAIVDPTNTATGFQMQVQVAGRDFTFELPVNNSNWIELPSSSYIFRFIADERLSNGEEFDIRNSKITLYKYTDTAKQNKEILTELIPDVPVESPTSPYTIIPDLGRMIAKGDGFGIQYKIELIDESTTTGADIPINAVDPESHVSVSLSERLFDRLIELRAPTLPSFFTYEKDSSVDLFMVMERIGTPLIRFERNPNIPTIFKRVTEDTVIIQQKIRIRGHVLSSFGLFSGDFDSGKFLLEIKASPALEVNGYRPKIYLKGLETNAEALVMKLLASYGDSLNFIEKFIFNLVLAPACIASFVSHIWNIDGIFLSKFINEKLESFGDSPDDYTYFGDGEASIRKVYWVSNGILERVSLDGDHRKVINVAKPLSFGHLTANHQLNRLYSIENDGINSMLSDGTSVNTIPINNAQTLSFDSSDSNIMYYTVGNSIYRASAEGANIERILTTTSIPIDVIGNSIMGVLVWSTNNGIYYSRFDSIKEETVIEGLSQTPAIALDNNSTKIFWCDHDSANIKSINLDGTESTDIVATNGTPNITIDADKERFFWYEESEKTIKWCKTDGSASDILVENVENISEMGLLLYPGVAGWVSLAKGFHMALRPSKLAITGVSMVMGCMFEVNLGGDNIGKYGPSHITVGIDRSNSPLGIGAPERIHMRDRLLEWMEYANLEFEIIPIDQDPWIKITWEEDQVVPESVAGIQGMWDNGVMLRLNPSLLWRISTDIGSPNPEFRLSYNFWMSHMLGKSLGIYNPVIPIEDTEDDTGPVMQELDDVFRDDYLLRAEDVQAVQGLFGSRPIPFRPQIENEAALEYSMAHALNQIKNKVTYRQTEAQDNANQLANGKVTIDVWIDYIDIWQHEDKGSWVAGYDAEYEMKFSAQMSNRTERTYNRGRINIHVDNKHVDFNHHLGQESFTMSDLYSGNLNFKFYTWIKSIDDPKWGDPNHEKAGTMNILLKNIGTYWQDIMNKFNNQSPSANPPDIYSEVRTGFSIHETSDPFHIYMAYRIGIRIPGWLNKVKIEEGQRQSTEIAIKQALPQQANKFLVQVKDTLTKLAETNIEEIKDEVEVYIQNLLDEIITGVSDELNIPDPNAIINEASILAMDLYRQVYPTPEDRERAIFDQVVREELLDVADDVLAEVNELLPESFRDYLMDNVLNENSPTALGYLNDQWGAVAGYLFKGVPYATARRIITSKLLAVRHQVKARAISQTKWMVDKSNKIASIPSKLVIEANQPGGIPINHPNINDLIKQVSDTFGETTIARINIPEFIPIGVTQAYIIINKPQGRPANINFEIEVVDTTAPQLTVPSPNLYINPNCIEGIKATHPRVNHFLSMVKATDEADEAPVVNVKTKDIYSFGSNIILITASDKSGNEVFGSCNIIVSPTRYSLYGSEIVQIGKQNNIFSGDIGAGDPHFIVSNKSRKKQRTLVSIDEDSTLYSNTQVYTDKLVTKANTKLDYVFCNEFSGTSSRINEVIALPERLQSPFPEFPTANVGTKNIKVISGSARKSRGSITSGSYLEPGSYGNLVIENGDDTNRTSLILTSGKYDLKSIHLGNYSQLLIEGVCEIMVDNSIITGDNSIIGPVNNGDDASSTFFFLNSSTNKDTFFQLGESSKFTAALFGRKTSIMIDNNARIRGAILGRKIVLRDHVNVKYDERIALKIETLQFLNAINSPEECTYMVVDDKDFGSSSNRAYGIRRKLAERIIETRKNLPDEKFTSIREVDAIYRMGEDTLHDLIETFSMEES